MKKFRIGKNVNFLRFLKKGSFFFIIPYILLIIGNHKFKSVMSEKIEIDYNKEKLMELLSDPNIWAKIIPNSQDEIPIIHEEKNEFSIGDSIYTNFQRSENIINVNILYKPFKATFTNNFKFTKINHNKTTITRSVIDYKQKSRKYIPFKYILFYLLKLENRSIRKLSETV